MSKWYSVQATKTVDYLIELEDEDASEEKALEVLSCELHDYDEAEARAIDSDQIDTFVRHAEKEFIWSLS